MGRHRRWAGPVLAALVAVLVPAGVLAATTVAAPSTSAEVRVGAAGLGLDEVTGGAAAAPSTAPTTNVRAAPVTVPTTVPVPASVRTNPLTATTIPPPPSPLAAAPPTILTPGPPVPSIVPVPPGMPSRPDLAPASNWEVEQNGIRLRMRMEPAAPVAGQQVRFIVEVDSAQNCCALGLQFTEGSAPSTIGSGSCGRPGPGVVEVPHTYANPGSYKVSLLAATFPCAPVPVGPDGTPVLPMIMGAHINGCVVVGPGTTRGGC